MIIYFCKLARKLEVDRVTITDYTIFTTLLYKRFPTIKAVTEIENDVIPIICFYVRKRHL